MNKFVCLVILFFAISSYAQEEEYGIYAQTGLEYDSNVLKTFNQNKGDFLARILLHAEGSLVNTQKTNLRLSYNGGGKKFFESSEQNMMIHSLGIPIAIKLNPNHGIYFRTFLKYQNENNDKDADNLDVNEDFFSIRQLIAWNIMLKTKHRFKLSGDIGYFHFFPFDPFSFYSETVTLEYRYQLQSKIWLSTQYGLNFQQFQSSDRADTEHEFSAGIHSFMIPYISLKYQFEINRSSVDLYDSTNHRITLLISHLMGKRNQNDDSALFSVHFLSTLQLRNFPSVTAFTAEGTRYLVTGAEDQNFNHVTLKLSFHPQKHWAIETKYSRFSNELSSEDGDFSRNLYYFGFRYAI
ncbi:MAG: hypothetical protein KDD46_03230 [Bdellovibrionales bacterium]|nr:hypothetical protein [Bdellovibrionales bacterium]